MKPTDNCEAFDMALALWYWLSHWHSGIRCKKYAAMCQITGEYKLRNIPSIDMDDMQDDENFIVRDYYHELTEENWEETFEVWCDYMNNQWDSEAC